MLTGPAGQERGAEGADTLRLARPPPTAPGVSRPDVDAAADGSEATGRGASAPPRLPAGMVWRCICPRAATP